MTSPAAPQIVRRRRRAGRASRPLKIVVTGPFAAGKTSFIRAVSEVTVVGTERPVSDGTRARKGTTTVAMDFGRVSFPDGLALLLFGTPGQQRFEVMWDVLSDGMIGFVLLVDASDPRSSDEAARVLATFREYADVPFVIGVTHVDAAGPDAVADVARRLDPGAGVPVVACDPRSREDVKALLLRVLLGVLQRLEPLGAVS